MTTPVHPSNTTDTSAPTSGALIAAAAQAVQTSGPSRETALTDLRAAIDAAGTPKAGPSLLIALDVDGTILHHDTTLSARVAAAIEAHRKAGTRLVLASGRGIYGTQVAAASIGITDGLAVCSNGAITIELGSGPERLSDGAGVPYSIRSVHTFNPSPQLQVLHQALPTALIAVERIGEERLVTEQFPPGELVGPCHVVPFEELLVPEATRVTLRDVDMDVEQMCKIVETAGMHGVEYNIGWSAWLDISPPGISKALALEELRCEFGIPLDACVAVGDGSNDLEMVEWAGLGVAMGGAPAALKEAADVVTTAVSDDGLAEVLELLL